MLRLWPAVFHLTEEHSAQLPHPETVYLDATQVFPRYQVDILFDLDLEKLIVRCFGCVPIETPVQCHCHHDTNRSFKCASRFRVSPLFPAVITSSFAICIAVPL